MMRTSSLLSYFAWAVIAVVATFAFIPSTHAALTFGATSIVSDGVATITGVSASTWSLTTDADAEDLTLGITGATDSSLILSSSGTGADALQITTTAGGIDITAGGTAAGEDLDLTATGTATEIRIGGASTQADAIDLNASAGGIDVDAAAAVMITGAAASQWTLATDGAADDLTVGVTGATDSSLILSSSGTGADALQITTTAGGLDVSVTGTAAGEDLDISTVGAATEMRLASASTEADAIDILTSGTGGGIDIDTTDGGITISAVGATNGDLTINVGDDFTLTGVAGSVITIGNANAGLGYYEETEAATATDTITAAESGKVFYVSGGASAYTLPAVADGLVFRFVVSAAMSGDTTIVGAASDLFEGSFVVAGAVVDCDAGSTLTFVSDGENLGDFVEVRSNGTKWFVEGEALTAAKLTCTG